MSKVVAEDICDNIREVCRSRDPDTDEGRSFVRVKVVVNITLPLSRGRGVTLESGERTWVWFNDERLPNLCYWCSCLDHDNKDCVLWIWSRGTLSAEDKQFGPSLKASPFFSSRNNVVVVLGFYEDKDRRANSSTDVLRTEPPLVVDATVNSTSVGSSTDMEAEISAGEINVPINFNSNKSVMEY